MQVANISQFRKNLKSYIETVSDNHDTLIVNGNGKTVVVISLDEYNSMDETTYLTSTVSNKEMMYKAKGEIETGKIISKTADELAKMIADD